MTPPKIKLQPRLRSAPPTKFSVMTFNIWMDPIRLRERICGICQIITSEKADVICLQEVTADIYRLLQPLAKDYYFTKSQINQAYDTCTLVHRRHQILSTCVVPFISLMERNLEITTVNANGVKWTIGNFHLESAFQGPLAEYKRQQLKLSLDSMARTDPSQPMVLMGDTNFGFKDMYRLPTKWQDAWIVVGKPKLHTWTNDGKRNTNLAHHYKNRMDRIFIPTGYSVLDFRLVGTAVLDNGYHPSDHFGVSIEIETF